MSSCSGIDIFGDNSCAGLTPVQEQELVDAVEKTQLQSFVAPDTTNFSGNLTVNGLPVSGGDPFDQSLNTTDQVEFISVDCQLVQSATNLDISSAATLLLEGNSVNVSNSIKVYDPSGASVLNSELRKNLLIFKGDPAYTSYGQISYFDGTVSKSLSLSVDKGNYPNASQLRLVADGAPYYFYASKMDIANKRISNLGEPIAAQDATTKDYVDLRNFQNHSFRNVNGKTTLPGGVPIYNATNPVITRQYQLPQGDYYFRYRTATSINICLKSLSDDGTATGDDVYQVDIANFWDKSKFPSVSDNYNRSIPINADTLTAFSDPYINIGWDAPGNDIELTMLQLPPGVSGIYALAVPHWDAAASIKTYITQTGLATDVFPNGINQSNTLLNLYINPSSNPTDDTYPSYNIQFRRVDDVLFMKLDRYFVPLVV